MFGARRPSVATCRRGRFGQVPPTAPLVPGWVRHRVNPPQSRRGRFTGPPWVVPNPVPRCAQNRRPAWPKIRRGCFYRVPLVGAIITAPAYPPDPVVGRRPVPFRNRRGRFHFIPLVGGAAVIYPRHPGAVIVTGAPGAGGNQTGAGAGNPYHSYGGGNPSSAPGATGTTTSGYAKEAP
jgi:hypothetical protein